MDKTAAQAVVRTIEAAIGGPVVQVVTLGGSVPMYLFEGRIRGPLLVSNRESRQQSARSERKSPIAKSVGCDRRVCWTLCGAEELAAGDRNRGEALDCLL